MDIRAAASIPHKRIKVIDRRVLFKLPTTCNLLDSKQGLFSCGDILPGEDQARTLMTHQVTPPGKPFDSFPPKVVTFRVMYSGRFGQSALPTHVQSTRAVIMACSSIFVPLLMIHILTWPMVESFHILLVPW